MPNLGEKNAKFRTGDGLSSEVTDTGKPLASVSKKGKRVVSGSDRSCFDNVLRGKRIELTEENGTYQLNVDFLSPDFAGLVPMSFA